MLVVSDVRVDPRVQKSAFAAVQSGFRVTVVAPSNLRALPAPPTPSWGPGIEFEFPYIDAPALINHHYPWLIDQDLLRFCARYQNVLFHCHDLNTALMGLELARKSSSACIADFHEWFSENVEWSRRKDAYVSNRWIKRTVLRRAERVCMQNADIVITVCDSIANELNALHERPLGVQVVRNIPDLSASSFAPGPDLRALANAAPDDFVLLWQGGVGPSRLLEPIIEALQYAPGIVFVVRGPGLEDGSPFREYYAQVASRIGVQSRLRLLAPVPAHQVVAAAAGADAGIWTLPNLSKNFFFALPNKIFEYLAAGLPVLVANFPEAAGLVERYAVGLSFDPYSPRSIATAINRLKDDGAARRRMAANTTVALREMNAADEWSKVGAIYQSLVQASERQAA